MNKMTLTHRFVKALPLFIIAALLVISTPARADPPPECQNIPTSAEEVPAWAIDLCAPGQQDAQTEGIRIQAVTDLGWGPNNVANTLVNLALNNPQVLNAVGALVAPGGSFLGSAEFDNSGTFQTLYMFESGPHNFLAVNTTNANVTLLGQGTPFGSETITGLAMDPTTGVMYACSCDITASSLYTVNLANGATTRIGAITGSPCMIAMAFDNAGQLYGYDIVNDDFRTIDRTTGASASVGPLGFDANFGQGMDFDEDTNTCYMFAFNLGTFQPELRICNPADGSSVLVGVLGATTPGGLNQMGGGAIAIVRFTLTVNTVASGDGTGNVTSDPAGINCGGDCAEGYAPGTLVTLTAHPGVKSYLASWSGDCVSTGALTAQVTMDADKTCTATFGYPIGGIVVPVDKLGLVAPWLGLATLAGLAALGVVVVRRRKP